MFDQAYMRALYDYGYQRAGHGTRRRPVFTQGERDAKRRWPSAPRLMIRCLHVPTLCPVPKFGASACDLGCRDQSLDSVLMRPKASLVECLHQAKEVYRA